MKTSEFDHTIRAAGAILNTTELLVIGSQAIHGSRMHGLPPEAERSVEVDIAAFDDDGAQADLLDGSIGEASMFHSSFGYFAQGVTESTAVLPAGWRERLVRYESNATNGVVAWCLEVHDLWISKAIANREKDVAFCTALKRENLVDQQTLLHRLDLVDSIDDAIRSVVRARIG